MLRWMSCAAMLLGIGAALPAAEAVPTTVTVRVIARDAKAIYDAVGGAQITITDQRTGKVLAAGLHKGKSSGSTEKIMVEPRKRHAVVYATPEAAAFVASIPLSEPTPVEIVAEGPVAHPQARRSASKSLLLLPGEHITGDGIVLEIHGLIVTADRPLPEGERLTLHASVMMACGCPITAGGLWDANEFTVIARLLGPTGAALASGPLKWENGRWTGFLLRPESPAAAVEVIAGHTATANFGMHRLELP